MNLPQLLQAIKPLNYVVQRNFEKLPEDMQGDLDVFVSKKDFPVLDRIVDLFDNPELVDIRTPGDGYYPPEIEKELLRDVREVNGVKVPNPKAHFLSLYYHNAVHKKEDKYSEKLKELFKEWIKPIKPADEGVGYHV